MRTVRFHYFIAPLLALAALAGAGSMRPAFAQAIAVIVNGDPITTTEVDEQMKFRRLIKEPATRELATEDLIGDRLKLRAANREGIDANETSFAQTLDRLAKKAGLSSQSLIASAQQSKLNIDLIRSHIRALAAWNSFVQARYKALAVSEQDIDAAIAKDASLSRGNSDYTLQQIVFVLPVNATAAIIEDRMRAAQALRGRFQDCASGVPLARALPDVAVKPPFVKAENSLSENTRKALEQVARGKLTAPERSREGIEMVAVCSKEDDSNASSVRDGVQASLLVDKLSKQADRMYQDLRARAVVEKH